MIDALTSIVGAAHVLTDRDVVAGAVVDWTGRFRGSTPAVVRPGDVDEVAAVVSWCASNGVALVPQGGNTGLVGGSVPLQTDSRQAGSDDRGNAEAWLKGPWSRDFRYPIAAES